MKELLEGYVGVKYAAVCRNEALPVDERAAFRRCGDRLREHRMTPANGGNMSLRVPGGFLVTTSGSHLGALEPADLALVHGFDLASETVSYSGPQKPSSEAMLHGLILERFGQVGAVVHAHDEAVTSGKAAEHLPQTAREEPYGTVALAELAAAAVAGGGEIIVLRNHGYVAVGQDLDSATDVVVREGADYRWVSGW